MIVRRARRDDQAGVLALARSFATSFVVDAGRFELTFPTLLDRTDRCVLVAEQDEIEGYLLGFLHPTFYANGPVGWVEELMVAPAFRRQGLGRRLVSEFESWVEAGGGHLVALATRRAAPFYRATGYEESATYFRKLLGATRGPERSDP